MSTWALGRDPGEVAARLERDIAPAQRQAWSAGTPTDWANEGDQIARSEIYSRISGQGGTDGELVLTQAYARRESNVAAQQLEKAGMRLAMMLNASLR